MRGLRFTFSKNVGVLLYLSELASIWILGNFLQLLMLLSSSSRVFFLFCLAVLCGVM